MLPDECCRCCCCCCVRPDDLATTAPHSCGVGTDSEGRGKREGERRRRRRGGRGGRPVICRIICQHRGESARIISDRPTDRPFSPPARLHPIRPSVLPMTRVGEMDAMICSAATAMRREGEKDRQTDNGTRGRRRQTDTPRRRMHYADFTGADSLARQPGSRDNHRLRQAGAVAVRSRLATPRREDCGATINRVRRNS